MSLVAVAAAGCRELASLVDAVGAALGVVLRLNYALASRLVALLSQLTACLLLLLDRAAAALQLLGSDLAAFLGDVGGAICDVVEALDTALGEGVTAARTMGRATAGGFGAAGGAVLTAVGTAVDTVRTVTRSVVYLSVTSVRGVALVHQTVVSLLAAIPHGIVYGVVYLFARLTDLLMWMVFGVVSTWASVVSGILAAVHSVPPAAMLGLLLVLAAVAVLRRLLVLVPPPRRVLAAAAAPVTARLRRLVTQTGTLARLALAVVFAAAAISSRCICTFVQNVWLGLRPAVRPGRAVAARPAEEPEARRQHTPLTLRTRGKREDVDRLCVVCQDSERSVILLPCRHLCVCPRCCRTLGAAHYRTCPLCRAAIQQTMQVYV